MRNYKNIEDVMEKSIELRGTVLTVYPHMNYKQSSINVESLKSYEGAFSINNGVICFIYDNRVFSTPATRKIISILHESKLVERYFYVPFSNGEFPFLQIEKWKNLQKESLKCTMQNFKEDCIKWSKNHKINELSSEILQNCLKVPSIGIEVQKGGMTWKEYPGLNQVCFDGVACNIIGKYSHNNGVIAFIYYDGSTYITRKRKNIFEALDRTGYKQKCSIYVPLSNGERILDRELENKWAQCF